MFSSTTLVLFWIVGSTVPGQLSHIHQQITTSTTVDIDQGLLKKLVDDYIVVEDVVDHINGCFGVFLLFEIVHQSVCLVTASIYLHISLMNSGYLITFTLGGFVTCCLLHFACIVHVGEQVVQQVTVCNCLHSMIYLRFFEFFYWIQEVKLVRALYKLSCQHCHSREEVNSIILITLLSKLASFWFILTQIGSILVHFWRIFSWIS